MSNKGERQVRNMDLDNLIEKIVKSISENMDSGYDDETIEMIKALSSLISARASLIDSLNRL